MNENGGKPVEEQLTRLLRFCGKTLHHGMGGKCSQDRILMILDCRSAVTQRELMDMIGIQSGSMSEIISKIEENGLLRRVKNEADKRHVDVILTEAGKREAALARQRRTELEAALYAPLTEEEKIRLIGLLEKLEASWRADDRIYTGRKAPIAAQKPQKGAENGHEEIS